ncbi:MAG: hypothetical protein JHC84_14010 [Solirubrobacteraceae bacterium]|nr:hypothetical protein [Solirubrobacteraceae bacterium]
MVTPERPPASAVVQAYLAGIAWPDGALRTLSADHWGLSVEAAGWPLDIGLAVRHGVLRAQAEALRSGVIDAHELLYRNRRLRLVRYTHAADGTVWVEADLPQESVTAPLVDRLLGGLVAAAVVLRERATDLGR